MSGWLEVLGAGALLFLVVVVFCLVAGAILEWKERRDARRLALLDRPAQRSAGDRTDAAGDALQRMPPGKSRLGSAPGSGAGRGPARLARDGRAAAPTPAARRVVRMKPWGIDADGHD